MPVDPLLGTTINGYTIQSRLGEGGMGVVYRGEQTDIGKRVAIKVLKPGTAQNRDVTMRLIAEARAVNSIRHRGIVDIFGYAKLPDGRQCILMELLEGEPLEAMMKRLGAERRTLPLPDVLGLCDEMLVALGAAHAAGVVHRDLKPSNIFLCAHANGERHVKLLDFGVAKMNALDAATASGVLGTPLYMAPEQAQGQAVTPAIDLYAFGVILFELLTGRPPFWGENAVRVIYQHVNAAPEAPSSLAPSLPRAFDDLVLKLLAKRAADRPRNTDEVRAELARLKAALADPSALPTLDDPAELPPVAPRRSALTLLVAGATAAALAAIAVVFLFHRQPPVARLIVQAPPPSMPMPEPMVAAAVEPSAPVPEPAPAPAPAAQRGDKLLRRIEALEKKVAKLKKGGDDVELYERQLPKLREGLSGATPETREQIELAVTRLEEDLR